MVDNHTPQVLNIKDAPHKQDGVFIGRPSKWGNPFVIGRDGTRADVIEKYERRLQLMPELATSARLELRGKNLVCYCAPKPCHGNILLRMANADDEL